MLRLISCLEQRLQYSSFEQSCSKGNHTIFFKCVRSSVFVSGIRTALSGFANFDSAVVTCYDGFRYNISFGKHCILWTNQPTNDDIPDDVAQEALAHLDLLDAHLDLDKNITDMELEMQNITNWDNIDSRPWINWNLQVRLLVIVLR